MTLQELIEGWRAGRRRVVLLGTEDEPITFGELLGPDCPDEEIGNTIVDAGGEGPPVEYVQDVWVVCLDRECRPEDDNDGLRGAVPSSDIEWED